MNLNIQVRYARHFKIWCWHHCGFWRFCIGVRISGRMNIARASVLLCLLSVYWHITLSFQLLRCRLYLGNDGDLIQWYVGVHVYSKSTNIYTYLQIDSVVQFNTWIFLLLLQDWEFHTYTLPYFWLRSVTVTLWNISLMMTWPIRLLRHINGSMVMNQMLDVWVRTPDDMRKESGISIYRCCVVLPTMAFLTFYFILLSS